MNMIDSKQVMAMADYEIDRAKSKLDDAIDSEETRDELIAARAQELIIKRMAEMSIDDILGGLHMANEGAAKVMRDKVIDYDMHAFGVMVRALICMHIEQDSEVMANDWMDRVDAEVAKWGSS